MNLIRYHCDPLLGSATKQEGYRNTILLEHVQAKRGALQRPLG